jgi:Protein of unknown function (DUF2911)
MRTSRLRRHLVGAVPAVLAVVPLLSAAAAQAQWPPLSLPRASQAASVAQTIGVTRVSIDYSRPLVKGREIWGALVPYDQVWRAGANENTRVEFSTPVTVQGQPLPAGSYGLHMIPTKGDWTLAFSKVDANWGSFRYDAKDDALRVSATPEPGAPVEALTYTFEDPGPDSVRVVLSWEKLRIPFTVAVDTKDLTVARLDADLHGLAQFFWQPWSQAANFCLQNDVDLDRAEQWVDRSISMNENFANDNVKSQLLAKRGDRAGADALLARALAGASEAELNAYGYQQMNGGELDAAIATFRDNLKRHPESWNAHDSLGEGLAKAGRTAEAIQEYRQALAMAPEAQKARIQGVLDGLAAAK